MDSILWKGLQTLIKICGHWTIFEYFLILHFIGDDLNKELFIGYLFEYGGYLKKKNHDMLNWNKTLLNKSSKWENEFLKGINIIEI